MAGASLPAKARLLVMGLLVSAGMVLAGQGAWIHAKAFLAQILLDRAFDQSVATGTIVKPWPWLDTYPAARIEVPRLDKSAVALEGASGQALAFGPAHVAGTPEAGEDGTAVYAAHRDTHFAFLGQVKTGDEIAVTRRDGVKARYRVTGHDVRRWDNSGIDGAESGRHLVLATCWPFNAVTSGPLRYLVFAEAVD
ncbi:class GN sortase [Labrys neptuniae]